MADIERFVTKELAFDLRSDDVGTRRHALCTLCGLSWNDDVRQLVERVAESDSSDELRYIARKYLAEHRSSTTGEASSFEAEPSVSLPDIFARANRDKKIDALWRVAEQNDPSCLPQLFELLEAETDSWVVASLVKAIGSLGSSSDISRLQPYLEHSDPRVQANTIEALDMIGDDVVFPLLVPQLRKSDNRVRANAIKALMKYDRVHALETLAKMASSTKEAYRDSALYCFALIEADEVVPAVMALFEREDSGPLLKKASKLLAKRGTAQLTQRLQALVEGDNRDRSLLAKYVLSHVKDRVGPPGAAEAPKRRKMSKAEAARRVARLMAAEQSQSAPQWYGLLGVIGVVILCVVGAMAFTGGGFVGSKQGVARLVKSVSDDRAIPDKRGEPISATGQVRTVNQKDGTVLVRSDNQLLLVRLAEAPWNELSAGTTVTIDGEVTGRTRFGAFYVRGAKVQVER